MESLTARQIKTRITEIDFSAVPEWPRKLIDEAFYRIRDERFLVADSNPNFPRRVPWVYVENGCFLKATLVRRKFEEWGYPSIKKLFVFGDMEFDTRLSPKGRMGYKDHVAVVVRHESTIFLIDASVNTERPMELYQWATFLSSNSDPYELNYSLCSQFTFGHNSPAFAQSADEEVGSRNGEMRDVDFFSQDFLKKEWDWVLSLGLNPMDALGDNPVWPPYDI